MPHIEGTRPISWYAKQAPDELWEEDEERRTKMEKRTFQVAGVQFRPTQEIATAVKKMVVGDQLLLESEPTNKFDPNAVKILYVDHFDEGAGQEKFFLGYVPKKYSAEISGMIDIGLNLECVVDEVLPSGKPWEMIKVTIKQAADPEAGEFEGEGKE